ncbi:MAG: sporulation protein YabP [Clostridia bacterium]|nr:sporulation protein YabP [Clostridia bacterium]
MAEQNNEKTKKHTLVMNERASAEISGVSEVESFDDQCVVLSTVCGGLTLEGEGLRIGTLDIARGVVEVSGKIGAVIYNDQAPAKRGFRARFFG